MLIVSAACAGLRAGAPAGGAGGHDGADGDARPGSIRDEENKHGLFTWHLCCRRCRARRSAPLFGNGDGRTTVAETRDHLDEEMRRRPPSLGRSRWRGSGRRTMRCWVPGADRAGPGAEASCGLAVFAVDELDRTMAAILPV